MADDMYEAAYLAVDEDVFELLNDAREILAERDDDAIEATFAVSAEYIRRWPGVPIKTANMLGALAVRLASLQDTLTME